MGQTDDAIEAQVAATSAPGVEARPDQRGGRAADADARRARSRVPELRVAVAELRLACSPTPESAHLEDETRHGGWSGASFRVYRPGKRRMLRRREPPVFLGWRIMSWLVVPAADSPGWLEAAVEQMLVAGGSQVWSLDQGEGFGWRPIGAEASMNEAIRRITRLVVYVRSEEDGARGTDA